MAGGLEACWGAAGSPVAGSRGPAPGAARGDPAGGRSSPGGVSFVPRSLSRLPRECVPGHAAPPVPVMYDRPPNDAPCCGGCTRGICPGPAAGLRNILVGDAADRTRSSDARPWVLPRVSPPVGLPGVCGAPGAASSHPRGGHPDVCGGARPLATGASPQARGRVALPPGFPWAPPPLPPRSPLPAPQRVPRSGTGRIT